MYTPVIDDKPADDIICSLHCVLVGAKVGIVEGDLDGLQDGLTVGELDGEDGIKVGELDGEDGLIVGEIDGSRDGDMEGVVVGALGITVGDDVGMLFPVGSHSNTFLSYELKATFDIERYVNSPLKYSSSIQFLPICPFDTLGIFLAELTNVFIAILSLYIVRVLVLVSYTDPYTRLSLQQIIGVLISSNHQPSTIEVPYSKPKY